MSLNPFTAIEKLINERGSANIMKERLGLAGDQFAALEKENADLRVQLAQLASKVDALESSNANLQKELAEHRAKNDVLDEPTAKVLKLLFDSGDGLDIDAIRSPFGFTVSEAKFHIGILMDLKFIEFQEGLVGFGHTDAFGDSHYSGGSPDTFHIQQKGRAYIMKKG